MTLNDLEWLKWSFYVKFSLFRTDFETIIGWLREYYLLIYCRVCLRIRVISEDVGSGVTDRDPQNVWNPRKTADLS